MNLCIQLMLDKAISNNLLCYDIDNKNKEVTNKLLMIMTEELHKLCKETPQCIVLDTTCIMLDYLQSKENIRFPFGKTQLALMISETNAILGVY